MWELCACSYEANQSYELNRAPRKRVSQPAVGTVTGEACNLAVCSRLPRSGPGLPTKLNPGESKGRVSV